MNEQKVVFISLAEEDEAQGRRLGAILREVGIEVWVYYQKIRGGYNIARSISDGLEESDMLLIIWSEAASRSEWVECEWTSYVGTKKPIIPCRFDKTPLPQILRCNAHIDFSDFEKGLNQLFFALGFEKESIALS